MMKADLKKQLDDATVSIFMDPVSLEYSSLKGTYLAPRLHEELRIRLQRIWRTATGEEHDTLVIEHHE